MFICLCVNYSSCNFNPENIDSHHLLTYNLVNFQFAAKS